MSEFSCFFFPFTLQVWHVMKLKKRILPHSFPYRRHLLGLIRFGTQSHSNLSGYRDKDSFQFVFQFIHMTFLNRQQVKFSFVVLCTLWQFVFDLIPSVNVKGLKWSFKHLSPNFSFFKKVWLTMFYTFCSDYLFTGWVHLSRQTFVFQYHDRHWYREVVSCRVRQPDGLGVKLQTMNHNIRMATFVAHHSHLSRLGSSPY